MADRERRIDEQLRRSNERLDRLIEALSSQGRLLITQSEIMRAQTEHLLGLRDESRAQTMALFRMIDRLDGLDPGGSQARA